MAGTISCADPTARFPCIIINIIIIIIIIIIIGTGHESKD
jgi:hypothetical protein